MGPAVSRLDFFQVVETSPILEGSESTGETLETRERHISVVVPTVALIEFMRNTLNSLAANKEGLSEAARQQSDYIKAALSSYEPR